MERYAGPLRQRAKRDGPQKLVQVCVCAGALIAAGALTIEARIRTVSPSHPTATAPISVEPKPTPAELGARAAAQKSLAEALGRARALQKANAAVAAPALAQSGAALPSSKLGPSAVGVQAVATPLSPPTTPAEIAKPLPEAELKLLAIKAAQALKAGDIGGARMVLERAAGAGDVTALFALGETYDPDMLAKMRVRGLKGDRARALDLYKRAGQAGVAEAQKRLEQMSDGKTASVR